MPMAITLRAEWPQMQKLHCAITEFQTRVKKKLLVLWSLYVSTPTKKSPSKNQDSTNWHTRNTAAGREALPVNLHRRRVNIPACPALMPFIQGQRYSTHCLSTSGMRRQPLLRRRIRYENSATTARSHCNPATGRLNSGLGAGLSSLIELIAIGVDV